ncbi:PREDICTED: LOW QUALITY PROTEIN: collagen alpha-1(IX) chain-like, partial [Tinamus guttatus]|uniref:LOW QUALITY PROTEIN: collagen alpha-1(IX) chain-like n=1 Tax=Tinamus guttatus TaxID=94827 RepID=UPI00052EA455
GTGLTGNGNGTDREWGRPGPGPTGDPGLTGKWGPTGDRERPGLGMGPTGNGDNREWGQLGTGATGNGTDRE